MSHHLSQEDIEAYMGRRLSAARLLDVSSHLSGCAACREQLRQTGPPRAALASLWGDLSAGANDPREHPGYEQLAAYADGRLDASGQERVDGHVGGCSECRESLGDLLAIAARIATGPRREYTPATQRRAASRGVRAAAAWRAPAARLALGGAGAAALAVLAAWLATQPLRGEIAVLRGQVARLQVDRQALAPAGATVPGLEGEVARLRQENETLRREAGAARALATGLRRQLAAAGSRPGLPPPSAPAGVRLALADGGGRITLDAQGRLAGLEGWPAAERQAVKAALLAGRVSPPADLAELAGGADELRAGAAAAAPFALARPVATGVRSDRPTFSWRPLPGATSYSVAVFDTQLNEVARSSELSGTDWTPTSALPRGGVYTWQVIARKEGQEVLAPIPPAPPAKFKVLPLQQAVELDRLARNRVDAHLPLGLLYARAGLLDEAEEQFHALLAANPRAAVARRLLRSGRALRGAGRPGD